jgi:hypothetical protein
MTGGERLAHMLIALNAICFVALHAVRLALDIDLLDPAVTRWPAVSTILAINMLIPLVFLVRRKRTLDGRSHSGDGERDGNR